jgi:hypothetical protein
VVDKDWRSSRGAVPRPFSLEERRGHVVAYLGQHARPVSDMGNLTPALKGESGNPGDDGRQAARS